MAFAHAPLEAAALGPMAGKFVGDGAPDKMRKMVASGMAPLPPRDMLVALYQLWVINDDEVSDTAGKTVEGLPEAVLAGALGDRQLPAGVLDLLGRKLVRKEAVIEQVVRHPQVDDETLIGVSRVCSERICDILAENETRWLACPGIVGGLFQNRHCRMSVVHRMIELAEREGVELNLPAMEEIRAALAESGPVDESLDAAFKQITHTQAAVEAEAAALDLLGAAEVDDDLELPDFDDASEAFEGELPSEAELEAAAAAAAAEAEAAAEVAAEAAADADAKKVTQETAPESPERRLGQLLKMRPIEKIRAAMMGDKYDRSILVRDSNKIVAMATIKSPKVRDNEAIAFSANRALSNDVLSYIASRRDWIKLYKVKLNLVMNPKTPMARSMALLNHLNRSDVQKVARSKGIPSALATAAKRKAQSRG
ncbi:hypothetical protein G6O69_03480 [Pseudenhygromyxa sp. WMMC2535]|uniref:hypothetical protein n=1 Tax=Pseudenhygromyxa sp. WMMC2535 TaxID=2712867 RepID=UPI001555021F|nr:hypothetical protein [Pseudenhygromyxa sp. WMMC2535]NVB36876.1 hypothetical protein [Pseudenhygromyxa sp. WMMC2535]